MVILSDELNARIRAFYGFEAGEGGTGEAVITFVGRVTHFRNDAQTDDDNSVVVVAVVENQMSGPGKHALRQGVRVDARIIPSN